MASNSLLECVVYAKSSASNIISKLADTPWLKSPKQWDESQVTDSDEDVIISHNWDELRRFMWDYVGIVRTTKRLERAQHRVNLLRKEISEYYSNYRISNDLIELRNLVLVAELIIESALRRKESRGLHFTQDYPNSHKYGRDTILYPPKFLAPGFKQKLSPSTPSSEATENGASNPHTQASPAAASATSTTLSTEKALAP